MSPRALASLAAWYLALHSFIERPEAVSPGAVAVFFVLVLVTSNSAEAPGPHCSLRNSFHFVSPRALASLAAWYLALHSFIERPEAVSPGAVAVFFVLVLVTSNSAEAPGPHCSLRNSFHFVSPRAFASLAAWYLALHSFIVRPDAVSSPFVGAFFVLALF